MHDYNTRDDAAIDPAPGPMFRWIRWCFLVFMFSFVFDYKSPGTGLGAESTGSSLFQYTFLGLALASGCISTLLGLRYLIIRPGVFLVLLWWGYIAFMFVVAILQGNEMSRIIQMAITPVLIGLAINVTMITVCAGMRPATAIKWFLIVGCLNVAWKLFFGFVGYGVSISEVRMEILSPAMPFLFAWVACALLLRRKFTWWTLVILGLPMATAVLSITRSVAIPLIASAIGATICLILAVMWRMYDKRHVIRKPASITAVGAAAVGLVLMFAVIQPQVIERWTEHLFDNAGEGATTEDSSTLMRKSEGKAMWEALENNPETFVYGKGIGAGYHGEKSVFPELHQFSEGDRHSTSETIYTAGHSFWTYTLFSSGWIGIAFTIGAFLYTMWFSLRAAKLNSLTVMGKRAPDTYLIFLPLVATLATLSESITRNPFDERFTGVLIGFMFVFPQVFYNRAFYLMHREEVSNTAPQIILGEDDLPDDWNGAFPQPEKPLMGLR